MDTGIGCTRFEFRDGIACVELGPDAPTLRDAIRRVADVLTDARAAGHGRLLLDIRGFRVPVPTLSDRIAFAREWAEAAGGRVMLALVCAPHLIDPERFGVVAAAGFGLRGSVFQDPDEALAWLREQA
jgi:hypothetical protein